MRTGPALPALLLGLLGLLGISFGAPLRAPLAADDVYLKNGRSFENVVAEVGDAQVRVHIPGGVISLPRSAVDRIKQSDSSFPEYLRRKQELESRARGPHPPAAGDWLELARWARGNALPQGAREAALAAAEINPREPGVAPILRTSGYVYEEALDRWVPLDESMRRHGFVQEGGSWVSPEEHAAHVRDKLEAGAMAAATARDLAAARAADIQAQMALVPQGPADNGAGYYGAGATLGGFYGGFGSFGGFLSFGGTSVFGVPGFVTRHGVGERGFGRHHGGTGQQFRGSVFGAPRGQATFRSHPAAGSAAAAASAGRASRAPAGHR